MHTKPGCVYMHMYLQHTAAERTRWESDSTMHIKAASGSAARRALEMTQVQAVV